MLPLAYEINFDSIVGQTHNYSGLSYGNLASMTHANTPSNPKSAALEGLEKMKLLHDLGVKQAVIPPHERPHLPTLRKLGFTGRDRTIAEKVYQVQPNLLFIYSSASPMWAANAATFTPSIDAADGKVHLTPANLCSTRHRAIEADDTGRFLRALFSSTAFFSHHAALPTSPIFTDEGAANHTRFCKEYNEMGVHLFVFGSRFFDDWAPKPKQFPARQTLEASQAIARLHKIYPERVVFAQQSPETIDAGAFHHDVVFLADRNLLFYHENAFTNTSAVIKKIQAAVKTFCDTTIRLIAVPEDAIPIKTAIETYLFNSQLITMSDKTFSLIAPEECRQNTTVHSYLEKLVSDPDIPIRDLHFVNLFQSMANGGGPACLRMRVVLTQNELNEINPKCLLSDRLYLKLKAWIDKHYRDRLTPKDLTDPSLVDEVQTALHELTSLLGLGRIYSFQGA